MNYKKEDISDIVNLYIDDKETSLNIAESIIEYLDKDINLDFFEDDGLMDIYSFEGAKVRYIAENGWDGDVPYANQYLTKGEVYTVDWVDVGGSCSYVTLKEFPDSRFNTVMFEEAK